MSRCRSRDRDEPEQLILPRDPAPAPTAKPKRAQAIAPEQAAKAYIGRRAKPSVVPGHVKLTFPPTRRRSTLEMRFLMSPGLSEARATTEDQGERAPMFQQLGKCEELALHEKSHGSRLEEARDSGHGRVRAMTCGEGIVDVAGPETRQRLREAGVVGLFGFVEPEIFEQEALPGSQGSSEFLRERTDAIRRQGDRPPEQLLEPEQHGLQRIARIPCSCGSSEVRRQDDGGAAPEAVLDRRNNRAKARVVRDLLAGQRHVEIGPQEHPAVTEIQLHDAQVVHPDALTSMIGKGCASKRDAAARRQPTVAPGQALSRMEEDGIRHLLVVDGDRLTGIVSNRDVRRLVLGDPAAGPLSQPVRSIMTEGPVTVAPELKVTEAARLLLELKIGALPVRDGGAIVGIFTTADALEALLAALERSSRGDTSTDDPVT
jgi:hypothetical protein